MQTRGLRTLATAFAILLAACHRQTGAIVAEVGDRFITSDQFRIRYAAYLSAISSRDNILLRKRVLDNMINETLIFEEMHRSGMDADSSAISRMTQVRNEALVMGYARHISLDTLTIGEAELRAEFRKFKTKLKARYLYGKSEADAWKLKDEIERGATFDSLARKVFDDPGLANNGGVQPSVRAHENVSAGCHLASNGSQVPVRLSQRLL